MPDYDDAPLEELAAQANVLIAQGALVYQKFTCEACGERATSGEANVFCMQMVHEDCSIDPGHVTETPTGGFAIVMTTHPEDLDKVERVIRKSYESL